MLECKDCCLYNTDACRYGRYALEHNMSLNCDDFIVEHNKAYQQGRADAIDECYTKAKTVMDELSYQNQGRRNGKTHRLYCIQALEFLRQAAGQMKEKKEENEWN